MLPAVLYMLTTHFKIAYRSFLRQRSYALMNVVGLGLGLACCIVIALFVADEWAYDRFHEHADRIYRVVTDASWPTARTTEVAVTSRPVADVLRAEYPEVEAAVRLVRFNPTILHEGNYFRNHAGFYAESSFFEVFTFPLLEGDPAIALAQPYHAVLTKNTARGFFGEQEALGQVLTLEDSLQVTVSGIIGEVPPTSHVDFDLLVSYATFDALRPAPEEPQWLELGLYTYLLLQPGVDGSAFEARIRDLARERYGAILSEYDVDMEFGLQTLTDIYLHSRRDAEIGPIGDVRTVVAFSAIALFVLLIACINFMNLATARSVQRSKEVGIRKALGAHRSRLAQQFLGESVLTASVALLLALYLVWLALPFASELAGKALSFATLFTLPFVLFLLGLTLTVGLLAGSYPAVVLSGFVPAHVLKGKFRSSNQGARLRKGLVAFQFAISVILIVGTLVVLQQMHYMRNQDLGFEQEQLLLIDARAVPNEQLARRYESIKQALGAHPSVRAATASATPPGTTPPLLLTVAEEMAEGASRRLHILSVDHDYTETYGLEVVAGRVLSASHESDAAEAALLNETAVRIFGWERPEDALGKWVHFGSEQRTVVGVVRDYHHLSLHRPVEPMMMLVLPPAFSTITLRLDTERLRSTLADLRQTWNRILPGYPFTYAFVDESFDEQYQAEARLMRIVGAFALLAIGLAALGLFGLAAFAAQQRRREVGIRKVLGATAPSIVALLSADFLKPILIAFLIAVPAGYLSMSRWLEGFAYRIELGPGVFVLAGAAALTIALLTVSAQALKAAWMNPTEAIRNE